METSAETMRAIEWSQSMDQQGHVSIELGGRWRKRRLRVDRLGITLPGSRRTVRWTEIEEVLAEDGRVYVSTPERPFRLPGGANNTLAAWLESQIDRHVELPATPRLVLANGEEEGQVVCYEHTLRPVDLDRLGLSAGLVEDLRDWDRRTRTNLDSPAPMAERVAVWEQQLEPQGRAIAAAMERELPPGSSVRLVDDILSEGPGPDATR